MGAAREVPDTAAKIKPAIATAHAVRSICFLPSLVALGGIEPFASTSTMLNWFRELEGPVARAGPPWRAAQDDSRWQKLLYASPLLVYA